MDPLRNLSSEGESTRWSGSALLKRKRCSSKTSRLILPVDSADGEVRKVGQTPRRKLKSKGGDQPSRLEVNDFKFLRRQLIGGDYTKIPLRLTRCRIRCNRRLPLRRHNSRRPPQPLRNPVLTHLPNCAWVVGMLLPSNRAAAHSQSTEHSSSVTNNHSKPARQS